MVYVERAEVIKSEEVNVQQQLLSPTQPPQINHREGTEVREGGDSKLWRQNCVCLSSSTTSDHREAAPPLLSSSLLTCCLLFYCKSQVRANNQPNKTPCDDLCSSARLIRYLPAVCCRHYTFYLRSVSAEGRGGAAVLPASMETLD